MKHTILVLAFLSLFASSCQQADQVEAVKPERIPRTKAELLQAVAEGRAEKIVWGAGKTGAKPNVSNLITGNWKLNSFGPYGSFPNSSVTNPHLLYITISYSSYFGRYDVAFNSKALDKDVCNLWQGNANFEFYVNSFVNSTNGWMADTPGDAATYLFRASCQSVPITAYIFYSGYNQPNYMYWVLDDPNSDGEGLVTWNRQ